MEALTRINQRASITMLTESSHVRSIFIPVCILFYLYCHERNIPLDCNPNVIDHNRCLIDHMLLMSRRIYLSPFYKVKLKYNPSEVNHKTHRELVFFSKHIHQLLDSASYTWPQSALFNYFNACYLHYPLTCMCSLLRGDMICCKMFLVLAGDA